MNTILIEIGNIKIYWYSIMILLGILIGTKIILTEAKKFNISKDKISDLLFYTIIIGCIGARLYYVLFNLDYYKNNLLSIIKVWEGGLAIHGGIIAGALFMIFYTKKNNLNTTKIFDICVPGLLIGQALGRWGNFFNGEAHGPLTTLTNLKSQHLPNFIIEGMNINGSYYIPTFLYESLWCILILIIILIIRRSKILKNGQITSIYLIWYGIGRFAIEGLRTDSLMINNLKQAQIISILMILFGIIIFIISFKQEKYNKENQYAKNI